MDATFAGLEEEGNLDVREGVVEEGGVLDVLGGEEDVEFLRGA